MQPLYLALILALASSLAAADVSYLASRVGDTLQVYDPRPELGIGMHQMSDEQIQMVRDLGIRFVRHTMYWAQIEPTTTPREYDAARLAYWDDLVARCDRAGIILVVVVHQNAPGCSFANREESYRRFAGFMADMAARYPTVRYWELWNEMDGAFTDLFGAQANVPMRDRGRMYAEMLKLAYPAIKQANPRALVLTGGMTDTDEFPRGIYEAGGREFFDIMAIHTYGVPISWAFVDRGMRVREIMRENGDAQKPLWNTEFGIDAGNLVGAWGYPHDRDQEDGPALDRMMTEQWAACLDAAQKHCLYQKLLPYQFAAGNERNDDGKIAETLRLPEGHTVDDYGFGIVRRDGKTPRPVYGYLRERDFNRDIRETPMSTREVEFWSWDRKMPEGHTPNRWRPQYLRLEDFPVDSAYPGLVDLLPPGE